MDSTFFEEAADTLQDCLDHLADDLSPAEATARKRLVKLCEDIAFYWNNHVEKDFEG